MSFYVCYFSWFPINACVSIYASLRLSVLVSFSALLLSIVLMGFCIISVVVSFSALLLSFQVFAVFQFLQVGY